MRLIDADEYEKRIKPYDTEDDMDKALYNFAHYHLATTPSAQPEIIRCKDCKHYYYADNRIPQEQRYSCDLNGDRWKPDSFCSYGERRTDGEEIH